MAAIKRLFKSGKKEAPTTSDAIQSLRQTEDMLLKKQDFLEKKIKNEEEIMKKNVKTNKKLAISALKRKKRLEKELQRNDGTLNTLEQQRESLEAANINTAVLHSMSDAAKAIKKAHQDMDIDQVHDMMDEIADQQEVAKEISEAISNPAAFSGEFDEDELEAELEALELEASTEEEARLEKELLDVGKVLPDVPKNEPVSKSKANKSKQKKKDDDDMAELAAWAS